MTNAPTTPDGPTSDVFADPDIPGNRQCDRCLDHELTNSHGTVVVHNVVVRAERATGEPVAVEPTVGCDGHPHVEWFATVPAEVGRLVAEMHSS